MVASSRPMFRWAIDDLERHFRLFCDYLEQLQALELELGFRGTRRGRKLAVEVDAYLRKQREKVPFQWPNTNVIDGDATFSADFRERGALSALGYTVGNSGLQADERRAILSRAYSGELPRDLGAEYLNEWSVPKSDERLRKLAVTIATLARNAKRRKTGHHGRAIAQWESDLAYLKVTHYDGRWDFPWPSTRAA